MNSQSLRRAVALLSIASVLTACDSRTTEPVATTIRPLSAAPVSATQSLVATTTPIIRASNGWVCEFYPAASTMQCQKMWNFNLGQYGGADFGQYVASYTDANIATIALGPYTTCVLLKTGNTKCWGENATNLTYTGGDATGLSLSRATACVTTLTGRVKCLSQGGGQGLYATQLNTWTEEYGPSTDSGLDTRMANPIPWTGPAQWIVAAGPYHCFQTANNPDSSTLSCLGSSYANGNGAIDVNEQARYRFNGTPLPAASGSAYTGCVLMQEGNVDCIPVYYNDNGYVRGPRAAGNVGATDLSGAGATCALIPNGKIECWGSNFGIVGTLGIGYTTPYIVDVSAVAVGKPNADLCWLDAAGSVSCAHTKGPNGNPVLATAPVAVVTQTFTSGSNVIAYDPIPEPYQPSDWPAQYCTATPKVGLSDGHWTNPHNAFVLSGHPWANDFFAAPWINAWNNLSSLGSGASGDGFNWTKYETTVEGNGTFAISLLADNCSWIYLDGRLVGVQGTDLSKNSYGLTLNGTAKLQFIIFDGGGLAGGKFRLEATKTPPPPLDATAPVITPTINGTKGDGDWYTSNVGVSWSVVDNESAVTKAGCDALTLTANQAEQSYTCTATSTGGTTSSTVKIKIDQTKPTVTGAVTSGTLGANGWYTSNVGVTWTPSAAGPSGQTSSADCANVTLTTDSPGTAFTCTVTTGAGIASNPGTLSVKRDAQTPTISYVLTGTLGNNQWFVSDVGVNWTVLAGPSGAPGCTSAPVSTDGTGITFTCATTAGNGLKNSLTTAPAKRDATKPVVTYAGNAGTYTVDQAVAITCTPSDVTSKVASSTCAPIAGDAYSFKVGVNSFSASAIDYAGNTASSSTSFTVIVTNASLCSLVQRWVSNSGVANSMCVKLDKSNYEPFRNELAAQAGKKISDEHAAILLKLSNTL